MCYTMAIIKHSEDSIGMALPQDWRNRTGQPRGLDPDSTNQGALRSSTRRWLGQARPRRGGSTSWARSLSGRPAFPAAVVLLR